MALALLFSVTVAVTVVVVVTRPPQAAPSAGDETAPAAPIQTSEATVPNTDEKKLTAQASSTPASQTSAAAIIETAEARESRVEAEMNQLLDWSMNKDDASLSNILVRLTSSDKEVRAAAIEAAQQFGSTNAIPALKAAADASDDLREKIEYLEAAELLTLPPLPFNSPPAGLQEEMEAQALARQKELTSSGEQIPDTPALPNSGQQ